MRQDDNSIAGIEMHNLHTYNTMLNELMKTYGKLISLLRNMYKRNILAFCKIDGI